MPPVTTSGSAPRTDWTDSGLAKIATRVVGIDTRSACTMSAEKCSAMMPLTLPFAACRSPACWKMIVIDRAITVSTWPAIATGSAIAMPVSTLWPPTMTRIVEMVLARAESGDCAAPTFIQPSAISSRVPPRMMPVTGSPRISPVTEQAMSGR